jgi:hypothetical protein
MAVVLGVGSRRAWNPGTTHAVQSITGPTREARRLLDLASRLLYVWETLL